MSGKRSRRVAAAAAGVLTLTAAVSVAVMMISSGSGASAGAADDYLMATSQHQGGSQHQGTKQSAKGGTTSQAQFPHRFYRLRSAVGDRMHKHEAAVAKADAVRAAAKSSAKSSAKASPSKQAPATQATPASQPTQPAQPAPAPAPAPASAAPSKTAPAPSGSPQQVAQGMLGQFGWPASQFSCLQPLWEHESGWNVYAQNPSSGAYGIPQALPGSQMASAGSDWKTNPATQIRWGLNYIKDRYGSPCGAWAHEQAVGWY